MNLRTCLLPVFVAVLSACSAGAANAPANKAPIVDDVQGPATAMVGATGTYQLVLKITCHDDDGLITQASVEIPRICGKRNSNTEADELQRRHGQPATGWSRTERAAHLHGCRH
jgi:hypothetical protein